MGWIFAIVIVLVTAFSGETANANSAMISAGLFGIAGAISSVSVQISNLNKKDNEKEDE